MDLRPSSWTVLLLTPSTPQCRSSAALWQGRLLSPRHQGIAPVPFVEVSETRTCTLTYRSWIYGPALPRRLPRSRRGPRRQRSEAGEDHLPRQRCLPSAGGTLAAAAEAGAAAIALEVGTVAGRAEAVHILCPPLKQRKNQRGCPDWYNPLIKMLPPVPDFPPSFTF